MAWRDSSPIRYIRKISRRILRLGKTPARAVVARSRAIIVKVAHRSPWLNARLRRFRYYDHRLRILLGLTGSTPPAPGPIKPSQATRALPTAWQHQGHGDARKTPLESWFNR